MPRKKTTSIASINIVLQEHTTEAYIRFWRSIANAEKPIITRGDTALLIGSYDELVKGSPEQGIRGQIYRFLELDLSQEWFDSRSSKPANPDVVKREIRIPPYLKPNLSTFEYIFYPKGHRLMFETKDPQNQTLGIGSVEKMILGLMAIPAIAEEFPRTRATVEQSHEKLADMFALQRLRKLTIILERPNPDEGESDEAALLEELQSQGAKRQELVLDAQKGGTIKPSDKTYRLARVAMSNGSVTVEGRQDGKKTTVESKDHPRIEIIEHAHKAQTSRARFLEGARTFLTKILRPNSGQQTETTSGQ